MFYVFYSALVKPNCLTLKKYSNFKYVTNFIQVANKIEHESRISACIVKVYLLS